MAGIVAHVVCLRSPAFEATRRRWIRLLSAAHVPDIVSTNSSVVPMRPMREADAIAAVCLLDEVVEKIDGVDDVIAVDPLTGEWGGPTRGGTAPEPTRYGDWERRGRVTDF